MPVGGIDMTQNVTKNDLAQQLSETLGMTKKDALAAVNCMFSTMENALAQEGTVDIYGFGKFTVNERPERAGFNPATQEKIVIPASKTVKFKVSKALKDAVA
jgi:DNA-binding protein HU-beta